MSSSDRDGPTPHRLVISLAILAAVISPFVAFGLYEEARYKEISSYRADHYAEDADEAVKNACVGVAGREKAICLQEKGAEARLQKHDNERNEADLVAQRKSALWTSIMGFAALIGMGLSAIGVYLVWTTFRETRRSAKAAEDQLALARTVTAAELRPWVEISLWPTKFSATETNFDFDYELSFKNIGQTAAESVNIFYRVLYIKDKAAEEIDAAFERVKKPKDRGATWTLIPGEEIVSPGSTVQAKSHLPWREGEKGERNAFMIITATVFYWSAITNRWHRTDRSFYVGKRGGKAFLGDRYLPESLICEWAGEALADKLAFGQFRAGETT